MLDGLDGRFLLRGRHVTRRYRALLGLCAATAACTEEPAIPTDPDETPTFSAVFVQRDILVPAPLDTLEAGQAVDFEVTVFFQRAAEDTVDATGVHVNLRLLALDRSNPANADVSFTVADTTIPVSEATGTLQFTGTSDVVPACEGVRFLVVDARLRRENLEGPATILSRDLESTRVEEPSTC